MKKIFFVILLLIAFSKTYAGEYELVENSAYKYKDGVIYAVKDSTKNKTSVIFANEVNSAKIVYYDFTYKDRMDYYNLRINLNNTQKRGFNSDSNIQTIQEDLLSNIETLKKCPKNVCVTTDIVVPNYYKNDFLTLSLDDALKISIPNYEFTHFVKNVRKAVKSNWHQSMPKKSYHIALVFQINTSNGKVENLKIENEAALTKSQRKAFIKAVDKSSPFKIPNGFDRVYKTIPIKMSFKSNVRVFY